MVCFTHSSLYAPNNLYLIIINIITNIIIVLVAIYFLCMIKLMLRWCICSMWRMLLPSGKLIGL